MTNLEAILLQSNPPLRQRRQRTNFNDEALNSLEEAFAKNPYPDINERETMARELKTTEDRVQVWFQNKRARYRKRIQKDSKSDDQSLSIEDDSTATVAEKTAPVKPAKSKTKTQTTKTPIASKGNQSTPASTEMNYSPMMPSYKSSSTSRQFQESCYVNSPSSDSGFASFLSQPSPTAVASNSPHLWTNYAHLQHHLHSYLTGLGSPISPTSTAYNEVFADTRTFASSSPFIYNLASISNQTTGGSGVPEKKTRVAKSVFRPYE